MEKVRPWCGRTADRGRLKNRNNYASAVFAVLRAVLTNGHTGHVPRAPDFFLFQGSPTGCGEINNFFKLTVLLLMLLHDRTNTSSAYLVNLHITAQ